MERKMGRSTSRNLAKRRLMQKRVKKMKKLARQQRKSRAAK
jgi:hypothetical protein